MTVMRGSTVQYDQAGMWAALTCIYMLSPLYIHVYPTFALYTNVSSAAELECCWGEEVSPPQYIEPFL